MTTTNAVPVIAIDGPSASGKGTVAQGVARELGFHYLDSGALYRVVALAAQRRTIGLEDEAALEQMTRGLEMEFLGEEVFLDGARVTDAIRTEMVSRAASQVAVFDRVRRALLPRQRQFRKPPGLVAEGRDMGTVVFPDARLKIFLSASIEARAQRRHKQLIEKGLHANIATLLQELRARDTRDSERAVAPLRMGENASLIDTTNLTIEQSVQAVVERYRKLASKGRQ